MIESNENGFDSKLIVVCFVRWGFWFAVPKRRFFVFGRAERFPIPRPGLGRYLHLNALPSRRVLNLSFKFLAETCRNRQSSESCSRSLASSGKEHFA